MCNREFGIAHQGVRDVERHMKGSEHAKNASVVKQNKTLFQSACVNTQSLLGEQIIAAELKVTNFLVEHNVPLAASDHAGALLKSMFPHSKIAARYSAARTMTTALLSGALGPSQVDPVLQAMRNAPFSLAIDGSSDQELKKMYPLTVRIWDVNEGRVSGRFVKMRTTADGTGQGQYELIESFFKEESLRWDHCVGLSVDNAAVTWASALDLSP